MKNSLRLLPSIAVFLLLSAGCSSGGPSPAGGNGTTSSASENSLACLVEITVPMCQLYEATGKDAAYGIRSLRAGCVSQGGFSAKVVDACPTEGNLGGCKRPVVVKGGASLQLQLTDFFYKPAAGASAFGQPKTAMDVAERCAEEGAGSVYVAAP